MIDQQVLAANIDTVLLVKSLNQNLNLRRIERYLALVCGERSPAGAASDKGRSL